MSLKKRDVDIGLDGSLYNSAQVFIRRDLKTRRFAEFKMLFPGPQMTLMSGNRFSISTSETLFALVTIVYRTGS